MKKIFPLFAVLLFFLLTPVVGITASADDDELAWPGVCSNAFVSAVISGKTETALALLKDGTTYSGNINIRFDKGWRLLHFAAYHNSPDLCLNLIRMGAGLEKKDLYGNTPLHLAAGQGHVPCVLTLALKGANINAVNDSGKTPLHLAVENDCQAVSKALLRMGAKKDVKDEDGKTQQEYVDTEETKKDFETFQSSGKPSDGTPELLWESVQDNEKLYPSDREKIQEILDNPKWDSKIKKRMMQEILKKRGIQAHEAITKDSNPADDSPETLWEKVKDNFNLFASDKERIQEILNNAEYDSRTKKQLITEILKKRSIEVN